MKSSSSWAMLEKTPANRYNATASRKDTIIAMTVKIKIFNLKDLVVIGHMIRANFAMAKCTQLRISFLVGV
jgi:hypothetical protein